MSLYRAVKYENFPHTDNNVRLLLPRKSLVDNVFFNYYELQTKYTYRRLPPPSHLLASAVKGIIIYMGNDASPPPPPFGYVSKIQQKIREISF